MKMNLIKQKNEANLVKQMEKQKRQEKEGERKKKEQELRKEQDEIYRAKKAEAEQLAQ